MSTFLSRFRLVPRTIAVTITLIILSIVAVSAVTVIIIDKQIKQQVIDRQASNLRAAAIVMGDAYPELNATFGEDGNVTRLELPAIPEFANHEMIDKIGRITGETATVFEFEPENGDFWRRTTNIIKPDGNRAVGTNLGVNGAVHPVVSGGETFLGQATILGLDYYTIYVPIFTPDDRVIGILYAGVLKSQVQALLNDIEIGLVSAALVLLVISAVISFLVFRAMLRPIPVLAGIMTRMSSNQEVSEIPYLKNRDEAGDMASAIQVFKENAERVAAMEAEARKHEEAERKREEEARKREEADRAAERQAEEEAKAAERRTADEKKAMMQKMADDFEASVGQVVKTVNESASGIQRGAQTMVSMAADSAQKATDVSAASSEASTNVQAVSAATEELSASIQEISAQVMNSSKMASEAVDEANKSATTVQGLVESSTQIGEVVSLITDIAEQTNLLALNATIEAARAGDAGKGFAVVANEVKSLASQTGKATEEISRQIAAIQSATQNAAGAIDGISERIRKINEVSSAIAGAVKQQSEATTEIARNVDNAAMGTNRVMESITDVRQAAGDTGDEAGRISEAADALSTQAEGLRAEVEKFLAEVRSAA